MSSISDGMMKWLVLWLAREQAFLKIGAGT